MNKTNRKNIVDIVYSQISNVIELRTYGDDGLNQPKNVFCKSNVVNSNYKSMCILVG